MSKRQKDLSNLWEWELGDWAFTENYSHIFIAYPDEEGIQDRHFDIVRLPIKKQDQIDSNPAETSWVWDGSEEAPTLVPSILVENRWHGYMIQGRLEAIDVQT